MHECSITVTDDRLNAGRPTNIPLVVPGQACPGHGAPLSRDMEERAIAHALKSGRHLGTYESIEEAVRAARERSRGAHGNTPQPGGKFPQPVGETEQAPRGLVPLGDAMQAALGGERAKPAGRQPDAGPADPEQAAQEAIAAARKLLDGLKATVFPLEGARRMEPRSVTDFLPMGRDLEADTEAFTHAGPGIARPFEFVTPREQATRAEHARISDLLSDEPALGVGPTARR